MSKQVLPDAQVGFNVLMNVRQRAFFHKCAMYGFEPQTEQQAIDMLETAGKLRLASESQPKTASARDPFAAVKNACDAVLTRQGFNFGPSPEAVHQEYKEAAASFASDPAVYDAVLASVVDDAQRIQHHLARK